MSVLRAVLDRQPSHWINKSEDDYEERYLLFEVDLHSEEYDQAISGFDSNLNLIKSVRRVQNPFQMGLFKIQRERRKSEGIYAIPKNISGHDYGHPYLDRGIVHSSEKWTLDLDSATSKNYEIDITRRGIDFIRKVWLTFISNKIKVIGYHVIQPLDLKTAMKYPLDYRRYKHKNSFVHETYQQPKFYNSLLSAYTVGKRENLIASDEIIVIKCRYLSPIKNQGDYYPLYVINLVS